MLPCLGRVDNLWKTLWISMRVIHISTLWITYPQFRSVYPQPIHRLSTGYPHSPVLSIVIRVFQLSVIGCRLSEGQVFVIHPRSCLHRTVFVSTTIGRARRNLPLQARPPHKWKSRIAETIPRWTTSAILFRHAPIYAFFKFSSLTNFLVFIF